MYKTFSKEPPPPLKRCAPLVDSTNIPLRSHCLSLSIPSIKIYTSFDAIDNIYTIKSDISDKYNQCVERVTCVEKVRRKKLVDVALKSTSVVPEICWDNSWNHNSTQHSKAEVTRQLNITLIYSEGICYDGVSSNVARHWKNILKIPEYSLIFGTIKLLTTAYIHFEQSPVSKWPLWYLSPKPTTSSK